MATTITSISSTGGPHTIRARTGQYCQVSLAPADDGGSYTSGTLTFRAKAPGAADFEAISTSNQIDLASPQTLTIDNNKVQDLEITLGSIVVTSTDINLAITDIGGDL